MTKLKFSDLTKKQRKLVHLAITLGAMVDSGSLSPEVEARAEKLADVFPQQFEGLDLVELAKLIDAEQDLTGIAMIEMVEELCKS